MLVAPGSTSVSVDVFFADDTGAAATGKVASDFPVCRWSGGSNTADTTITLSDLAAITTAHPNDNTAGGVKEREGGWYRLDLPNNMFTSAGRKTLTFAETTNKRIIAPFFDVQYPQADVRQLLGTAWLTPGTAGTPDVNVKLWNALATVELPLVPTTAGRKLDVSAGGEAGLDWANVGSPTTSLALTGTTIATTQKVDVETVKTRAVSAAGAVVVGGFVGQDTAAIGVNASGHVSRVTLVDLATATTTLTTYTGNTLQTGDSYAIVNSGTFGNAAIKTDTGNLVTRITAALFAGITSMAQWLGLLAGKQTGNSTARTEVRATGAGSGTYDEATDALEALRDRGDAAWITADVSALATTAALTTVGTNVSTILGQTGTTGVVVASGSKTGYSLAAAGLDAVVLETGMNARQGLAVIVSACAGVLAGAATTTVTIAAAGVPATNRISAVVDGDGNRSSVTLSLPA